MEKVYYLDLLTLLEYLHGQPALLTTEITVPGIRGRCAGHIFFQENAIIGCMIQAPDGSIWREGETAYRLLSGNGEWHVRIDPYLEQTFRAMKQSGYQPAYQTPQPRYVPPPPTVLHAPRPIRPLDAALLYQFSTKERLVLRMVFMTVNGQRTVEQIKDQLRLPTEVVEAALTRLRALGVIE
jgi:hypothetical protein